MKRRFLAFIVVTSLIGMMGVAQVFAQQSSKFEVMIFPLECSIDELQTGSNTIFQITPENCLNPPPPNPEQPGSPPPESRPSPKPGQPGMTNRLDPPGSPGRVPVAFGYDSVILRDVPANRGYNRSLEIAFYLWILIVITLILLAILCFSILMKKGLLPIIFHRFRRRKH